MKAAGGLDRRPGRRFRAPSARRCTCRSGRDFRAVLAYTFTSSAAQRIAGGITTYSGVDPDHPVDAEAVSLNSTASKTVKSPSIETTAPNARLVQLAAVNAEGKLSPPRRD